MSRVFRSLLPVILLAVGFSAHAQTALQPLMPYEGTISTAGESERWTFSGLEGGVISVLVTSTSDLDPLVELRSSGGQLLASNDDFAYPGRRDALLQAVTLPRIDTYAIDVYGFGDSTGDYTITLYPGYPDVLVQENFTSISAWDVNGSVNAAITGEDGRLMLTLEGIRQSARIERDSLSTQEDFYVQARFDVRRAPTGWRIGFFLRQTDSGYYAVMLNGDGAWRVDYVNADGSSRQLRNWTMHPAIRAGATSFTLSVLANGSAFDVFYDNAWIGQVVETEGSTPDSGAVGLYATTPDAVGSAITAAFDDFLISRPMRVGQLEIMPSALVPGGQSLTIQELERRRVIPTGGTLALTVPESSGRQIQPGVNRVLLGRGATFADYVLYTTFTLTTAQPDALVGCGLLFGNLSDTQHAVAFLDRRGGYGLSARSGENFSPGLFGENSAFSGGQRHTLLLIKRGLRAELFVDRQHVGGYDLPAEFSAAGQIGNIVINYESSDTSCSFSDTWVWSLPE